MLFNKLKRMVGIPNKQYEEKSVVQPKELDETKITKPRPRIKLSSVSLDKYNYVFDMKTKIFNGNVKLKGVYATYYDQTRPNFMVEEVLGDLILDNSHIGIVDEDYTLEGFGKLKKVNGNLIINHSSVESFKNLNEIGGSVILGNSVLDLNNVNKIGGDLEISGGTMVCSDLESLANAVKGNTLVKCTRFKHGYVPYFSRRNHLLYATHPQNYYITQENIKEFAGKEIDGNVYISNCKLTDELNHIKKINGNLILNNSEVVSLNNLNNLGGSLVLNNSEIGYLNNLKEIKGELKLDNSKIIWNQIESVAGDILITSESYFDTRSLPAFYDANIFSDNRIAKEQKDFTKKINEYKKNGSLNMQLPNTENQELKMHKYYVNTIYSNNVPGLQPLDPKFKYVGMFSECDIKESKPIAGHFTDTRLLNTTMHALAVYQNEGYFCPTRGYYRHFGQLGAFVSKQPVKVNMFFPEIRTMDSYSIDVIEAKSVDEAIELFKNKKWRSFKPDIDRKPIHENNTNELTM